MDGAGGLARSCRAAHRRSPWRHPTRRRQPKLCSTPGGVPHDDSRRRHDARLARNSNAEPPRAHLNRLRRACSTSIRDSAIQSWITPCSASGTARWAPPVQATARPAPKLRTRQLDRRSPRGRARWGGQRARPNSSGSPTAKITDRPRRRSARSGRGFPTAQRRRPTVGSSSPMTDALASRQRESNTLCR